MKVDYQKDVSSQPPTAGGGRVNWLSAFVGLAVGLVLASVAWVQVLPAQRASSNQAGDLVYVPGDQLPEGATVAGPGGPRIIRGGRAGSGKAGSGGSAGSAGSGGSAGSAGSAGGAAGSVGGGAGGGIGVVGDDGKSAISSTSIKLGATVAEDGIAEAFLGEVRYGMEAVRSRINGAGGIEGRQLQIIYKQDSWDATRGQDYITRLITEDKVFALAVSPSSEGLNAAANAGLFAQYGVPVVGADGLNNSQFIDKETGAPSDWIWPVASATTTQAHIIMYDAWQRAGCGGLGANTGCTALKPAIVFGNTYRFGVEGAYAFNQAYNKLTGGRNIPGFKAGGTACEEGSRFCGISSDKGQYTAETQTVRAACNDCNFILLLLEPATALQWMSSFNRTSANFGWGMAGAQPLFTSDFATECAAKCRDMVVWTGYNPPCCYTSSSAVKTYVDALRTQKSSADINNQFTMGGYIGMSLLEKALRDVGKDLGVSKLREALNTLTLDTGLTNTGGLKWSASSKYANKWAQSFKIDYSNQFGGWRRAKNYIADPWVGQDNRLP